MKKYYCCAVLVLLALGTFLHAQTCPLTNTFNPALPGSFNPSKNFVRGSNFYVLGGNYMAAYNNSNPAQPLKVDATADYSDTCGDGNGVCKDIGMFPGDTMIFLSAKCHGVRAYDISNGKFSEKAYTNIQNNWTLTAIVTGGKRYMIAQHSGMWYYADYTSPGTSGNTQSYNSYTGFSGSPKQMDSFAWQSHIYIAMTSSGEGMSVYDVTSFPGSVFKVYSNTSLLSYGSYFYNGLLFAIGMAQPGNLGGLQVISVPSFQIVGSYAGSDFSNVGRVAADDRFAYLSLGSCTTSDGTYAGGLNVVNIQSLGNIYSIIPSDFIPALCPPIAPGDFVPSYYGGSYYFYVAGIAAQSVYEIGSCGSSANVVLGSFSPSNVDPGGIYTLSITLQNSGNAEAQSVSAALSTTDTAYVTVNTPATQNFGTIAAAGTVERDYSFTVASNAPASTIPFHLAISTSTGSYSADFSVAINAPHPNLLRTVESTAASPGLKVTYTNTGNADYTGSFSAGFSIWTTGVTINPASQTFGPIGKNQSQALSYGLTLPPSVRASCASPDFVSVHMTVSDSSVGNSPADFSVGLAGTANYPLILYGTSSLANAAGTYTLTLSLKNTGAASATNVEANLASDAAGLLWNADNMPMAFGTIAAGQTVSKTAQFTVSGTVPGAVTFTPSVVSTEGCWSPASFSQNMASLQFAYVDEKHCACGVNCSTLHPDIYEGSTTGTACINFYYELTNTGTSTATNVPATLQVLNSNQSPVSVTVNQANYTLNAGASGYNNAPPFQVSLTSDYCSGDDSTCPKLKLLLIIPDYSFSKEIDYTVKSTGGGGNTCVLSYKSGSLQITSDSGGDGAANPGETVQFSLAVQNTGSASAASVQGTISAPSSQSQYVSIQNATASYGTIAAGANATSATNYKITLTADAPTGVYYFPISISSSCSATPFTGTVALTVVQLAGDVSLTYQSYTVQDPSPGGNGDAILNPGETVTLLLNLANISSTAISGAAAMLSTGASGVSINSQGSFTAMAGRSGTAAFGLTLSAGYSGSTVPFTIAVSGATVTNPSFSISVGTPPPTITLTYQSSSIDDSTTGNHDGTWEPGETVKLSVVLSNTSSTAVSAAAATLSTSASGVTVNAQGSFSAAAGGTGTAMFTVTVSTSYTGDSAPFTIIVSGTTITNPSFSVPVYNAPPAPQALVIPVVAHASGAQGTNWKTDLNIFNTSTSTAQYTLKLIKSQAANDTPPEGTFQISPGGNLILLDVLNNPSLPNFQGYTRGSLLLEYSTPLPPAVTVRIYNDLGANGTYGQSVPTVPVNSQTRGTAGSVPSLLFGLSANSSSRSNLGVVNISSGYNAFLITLLDGAGNPVGTPIPVTLAPYNMLQYDSILSQAGYVGNLDAFSALVQSQTHLDFTAYSSIVDNITGDASFITDQIRSVGEALIPGVAHAQGASNTNWKTDLNIYNPASGDVIVNLTYYRYGFDGFHIGTRLDAIPSKGSRILKDVLSIFPGLTSNEAGFIEASVDNGVSPQPLLSARTYNDLGAAGTFGQFIPSFDCEAGGALNGQHMYFTGLSSNTSFRLNLGIINGSQTGDAQVAVQLYSSYGLVLGQHTYYLQFHPMGFQVSNDTLMTDLGVTAPFDNATLSFTVNGEDVFGYTSSVDNMTTDPIFITPIIQ